VITALTCLVPNSPHLNKAETYWRKAKYEWLKPSDYGSFAKFKKKVHQIFNEIGSEYKVMFKELNPST
jgi:transposase